jgi:predicted DNA-binding protein
MQSNQLALSPADSEAVRQLAQRTGKAEAELLHEAVEKLMQQAALENWQAALRQVEGLWADHPDAPDARQLRTEWESRGDRLAKPDYD